jgi:uncharacterized protein
MRQTTPMQEQTTPDRNVALVRRFHECYASGDLESMRNEVLAPDVRWTIPGHHPMSGTKQGAEEITAYFRQLQKADFKAETLILAANDEYVIDCHRGWGRHGDQELDILWCLLYRTRDGRIAEVVNFAADQHAADAFFWSTWQLKPIPERLKDPR